MRLATSCVLIAVLLVTTAGCAVTHDITLRDAQGRETTCEGVTGLYGVRSHLLVSQQRACVEDFQRQGYERVPEPARTR
jgi:hypothetical protein